MTALKTTAPAKAKASALDMIELGTRMAVLMAELQVQFA